MPGLRCRALLLNSYRLIGGGAVLRLAKDFTEAVTESPATPRPRCELVAGAVNEAKLGARRFTDGSPVRARAGGAGRPRLTLFFLVRDSWAPSA